MEPFMYELKEIPLPTATLFTPLKGLNWNDRPRELQLLINKVAQDLSTKNKSSWGLTNGQSEYHILNISQVDFMKKTIKENPLRKDFYFLDLGAGNFQSIRYLSQKLNEDNTLPKDIRVHCIGVRGESNQ